MAVAEDHPSVEELAAFILGTLGKETQVSIEAHVATCTSCQERAINTPGDSFVELLRSALVCTSRGTDSFVDAASQMQTPLPLEAIAVTDALMPAELNCPEVADAVPLALARHERYCVVRLLGAGGMGAVYEAEHRVMKRPVALKVIKRTYTASAAALERFRREVRAAARLSHPNIVATYDAEDAGETHFLVMEYVEGIDLGRLIQECGPLPVDRACDYIRQAALGLQYAFEQGMVHRDLKPHNSMPTPDCRVKMLDFGLAHFASGRLHGGPDGHRHRPEHGRLHRPGAGRQRPPGRHSIRHLPDFSSSSNAPLPSAAPGGPQSFWLCRMLSIWASSLGKSTGLV